MFGEAREQYEAFLVGLPPFDVMAPPPRSRLRMSSFPDGQPIFPTLGSVTFPGHVLPLEGPWISCKVMYSGGLLSILPNDRAEGEELAEAEELVKGGMSGSPVISATGAALGVISTSNWASILTDGLPGWLLRKLACAS